MDLSPLLIVEEPPHKLQLLLLQHLATFKTLFYRDDAYLTFMHVVKDQMRFFELFFFFLKKRYICQANQLMRNYEEELVAGPANQFFKLSIAGNNQLTTLIATCAQ